jgi:hypothetical protein
MRAISWSRSASTPSPRATAHSANTVAHAVFHIADAAYLVPCGRVRVQQSRVATLRSLDKERVSFLVQLARLAIEDAVPC